MRSSKSRSRNKNNRNRSVGNVVNRVFDSSGPEGKVRGTPQQIIDKYNQLARDAQLANDRVATENFQQHAEHYLRLLAEAQREQQERQQQQQAQNEARQKRQQSEDEQPEARSDAQEGAEDNRKRQPRGEQKKSDDVIDFDGGAESGLVETPEERPRRQRRPRKKAEEVGEQVPTESQTPTPDAAE